jgi:hypothetical protein
LIDGDAAEERTNAGAGINVSALHEHGISADRPVIHVDFVPTRQHARRIDVVRCPERSVTIDTGPKSAVEGVRP